MMQSPCSGGRLAGRGGLCWARGRAAGGRGSPDAREMGWRQGQLWWGDVGGLLGEQREKNLSSEYADMLLIHIHI